MERRRRARRGEGRSPHKLQNGYAIREFRELRRWSTTELANEVGISRPALSNIEYERRSASSEVLDAIADVLNIDVRAIKRTREGVDRESAGCLAEAVA